MSQEPAVQSKRGGKNAQFWRACAFLAPYRRIVVISVVCAFLSGLIFTSGLSAMLPILRVLINNDTLQGWVDRQIAARRFDVSLADDDSGTITRVAQNGVAGKAGVRPNDEIVSLYAAADPKNHSVDVRTRRGELITMNAPPLPWFLALLRDLAWLYPAGKGWGAVKTIAAVFLTIAGLAVLGNFVRFFQEYLSDKAAITATNDIRRHLYDHVLHIPMSFFGLSGTSDVTSRLVQDAQVLQDGFKTILGQSVQEPIKAAFAFGLALWIDWRLTMFIVVFAPVLLAVIKKFGKKMRRASRAALQKSSSMLGQIEGTLAGVRVVKAAGAERFERRRYNGIMNQLRDEQLRMARYEALATPAMETVSLMVIGCVLIVASYLVLVQKSLDPSSFFMIMACLVSIGESLRRVSKLNSVLARSNAAAARIFETLDMPVERRRSVRPMHRASAAAPEINSSRPYLFPTTSPELNRDGSYLSPSDARLLKLQGVQRDIEFDHVSFGYANTNALAVNDVSLRVAKGQSVAIVGRNGSGKTTLLALLPRFYDPARGRVMIDGVDVRRATLRSLRQQIAIVTQDPVIFPGNIAQNIAYGLPGATREQIEAAAKRAFCHDFILEKPQGYDAPLDGLGGQLSGGQKQRLNIARAILREAPILILDEATSQVDAESEHLIQRAIESIMHERTTFVIAHRFSTILSADTIVVMDRGRVVGQGKHEELLATCETYAQLYERQLVAAPM
jgi:ABC-type multidrug transport system fused ATPase/permease subunit